MFKIKKMRLNRIKMYVFYSLHSYRTNYSNKSINKKKKVNEITK